MKHQILIIVLACLIGTTANAEVLKSDANGFIVRHKATIPHSKEDVFTRMTAEVGRWWNADHSFSGKAGNMLVNSECFCEQWDSNLVRHLDTSIWMENSKVVMEGGLGPLKELGLSGTMVWSLTSTESGGTNLSWKYYVHGFSDTDLISLAPAVDGVLKEQLDRLTGYLTP